jgi:hypothetical protein
MNPLCVHEASPIVPPRTADAYQFVRGSLVVRRKHDAERGQYSIELAIGVRQRFGVSGFPCQLDTEILGRFRPASSSSDVRSETVTSAPA